ncbi:MAG: peptidyl-prolyl cis-trans isomerase [Flavobacteriaceae bacterium]|nr:peptidyl-prolyl cis-trans isomerase [Flavobacteriaceae bacterium]
MIKKIIITLVICFILPLNAQNKKDKVLLTIEDEPVYVSEFLRVYNKNRTVINEENKKNTNEYLDLFINYKLKLREAYDLKLDTVPSYIKEFTKYKKQLEEPFLKDREVTDKLVKEAYERKNQEVKASHILIKLDAHAPPKDTLRVYNKLIEAREKILNGAVFKLIAAEYSDDPSAKKNGGDLGYFTVFSMVYPFENAAYNTNVGDISMPFKTNFGYHIVQVNDKRASKGEIKVAHIMIKDVEKKPAYSKNQINDIYNMFKQGETFEFLAKKYSDDKTSAEKGGVLRKFSLGKMIQPFADESFALKNSNDVSKPFKTKFGWHFVKLLEKYPLDSYDNLKEDLFKKIEKSKRSVLVGKSIANRLKKQYNVKVDTNLLNEVLNISKDGKIPTKTFLTIKEVSYTTDDLTNYFKEKSNLRKDYNDFITEKVITYYKENLEKENPEYAATLKEYKDGLLLFDLLQKNIWTKAEKDTVGLQNFFDKNATNYTWKNRVKVDIASCTRPEKAKEVQKYLKEGKSTDEIKKLINKGETVYVLFNSGTYEIGSKKLPNNFQLKKGVSDVINEGQYFMLINVLEILPNSQKKLSDTKGKVISDYQNYLEKEWIKNLRNKYTYKINKKTLKKLTKNYK